MLIDNIKKYAKLHGMNLKEVAVKSGMSENVIYSWKHKNPSKGSIMAVAKTLNVTYEDLTGVKEKKTPTKVDVKAAIDDEDVIMTFEGKPIPKEDLEVMLRFLRGGQKNE